MEDRRATRCAICGEKHDEAFLVCSRCLAVLAYYGRADEGPDDAREESEVEPVGVPVTDLDKLRHHYAAISDTELRNALSYGATGYTSSAVWRSILAEANRRGIAVAADPYVRTDETSLEDGERKSDEEEEDHEQEGQLSSEGSRGEVPGLTCGDCGYPVRELAHFCLQCGARVTQ